MKYFPSLLPYTSLRATPVYKDTIYSVPPITLKMSSNVHQNTINIY